MRSSIAPAPHSRFDGSAPRTSLTPLWGFTQLLNGYLVECSSLAAKNPAAYHRARLRHSSIERFMDTRLVRVSLSYQRDSEVGANPNGYTGERTAYCYR